MAYTVFFFFLNPLFTENGLITQKGQIVPHQTQNVFLYQAHLTGFVHQYTSVRNSPQTMNNNKKKINTYNKSASSQQYNKTALAQERKQESSALKNDNRVME